MSGDRVELSRALELVLATAEPLDPERVSLAEAAGRRLAAPISSPIAAPGFDNAAMDGYAVRAGDLSGAGPSSAVELRVVGAARAGVPAERGPEPGEAVEIATGAAVPPGADAVVRFEEVGYEGEKITVSAPVEPGRDIRRRGEDFAEGQSVLSRSTRLGPPEVGLIASLGLESVRCFRRPRVALVTSGDELTEPGLPLAPGAIYNSNAFAIGTMISAVGGERALTRTVGDRPGETAAAIAEGLEADVLVTCGGISVGRHDLVRSALVDLGVEEAFHGIALKPGRPTWFGRRGSTRVFALPGNPVSAAVVFALLVAPLLEVLGGGGPTARVRRRLTEEVEPDRSQTRAVLCRRVGEDEGLVSPGRRQGSHMLGGLAGIDLIALLPPSSAGRVAAGDEVECVWLPRG